MQFERIFRLTLTFVFLCSDQMASPRKLQEQKNEFKKTKRQKPKPANTFKKSNLFCKKR